MVSFFTTESVTEKDLLDWAITAPDCLRSFLDAVSDTDGGTVTFLRTVRVLSGVSPVIARWVNPERSEEISQSVQSVSEENDPDDESDPEMPELEER